MRCVGEMCPWTGICLAVGWLALISLMVYLLRPSVSADFSIHVEGESVRFSRGISVAAQQSVEEFLLNDVALLEPYSIRGRWDGRVLVVSVSGAAKAQEQRIRNFLKLQLKPPMARTE